MEECYRIPDTIPITFPGTHPSPPHPSITPILNSNQRIQLPFCWYFLQKEWVSLYPFVSGIFLSILLQDSATLLHMVVDTHSTSAQFPLLTGCVGSFHFVAVPNNTEMEHSDTYVLVNVCQVYILRDSRHFKSTWSQAHTVCISGAFCSFCKMLIIGKAIIYLM